MGTNGVDVAATRADAALLQRIKSGQATEAELILLGNGTGSMDLPFMLAGNQDEIASGPFNTPISSTIGKDHTIYNPWLPPFVPFPGGGEQKPDLSNEDLRKILIEKFDTDGSGGIDTPEEQLSVVAFFVGLLGKMGKVDDKTPDATGKPDEGNVNPADSDNNSGNGNITVNVTVTVNGKKQNPTINAADNKKDEKEDKNPTDAKEIAIGAPKEKETSDSVAYAEDDKNVLESVA